MPRLPKPDLRAFQDAPDDARCRINLVQALFSFSAMTVWRRVKDGRLPAPYKDGGCTYWKAGDLRRALAGNV